MRRIMRKADKIAWNCLLLPQFFHSYPHTLYQRQLKLWHPSECNINGGPMELWWTFPTTNDVVSGVDYLQLNMCRNMCPRSNMYPNVVFFMLSWRFLDNKHILSHYLDMVATHLRVLFRAVRTKRLAIHMINPATGETERFMLCTSTIFTFISAT